MRIVVAGAGIGGLVAAMKLHDRGHDVVVHESVRELAPLGVGINILPHAMAVLDTLGLVETLLDLGVATAELAFFNRHGQLIWREPHVARSRLPGASDLDPSRPTATGVVRSRPSPVG